MALVIADKLSKSYGDIKAVEEISFSIGQKQIVSILGANGAGKSTTINMLTGLLKPTSGKLTLFGKSYVNQSDAIRRKFGYVPEESSMYEDVGIYDYLRFFADVYGVDRSVAEKRIMDLLARLHLDVGNRQIGKLSKGMKRKVLLVRSLVHDPKLLIYDEPASGLDPQTAHFILEFMLELKAKGKAIVFSSHHLAHVEKVADHVIIIHKGKIVTNKTVPELVQRSQSYVVRLEDGSTKAVGMQGLQELMKLEKIVDIQQQTKTLEEVFLEMTR